MTEPEKIRLLLVEDDTDAAELLSMSLMRDGFETTVATSLEEAQQELKKSTFDALLADRMLPDGQGESLASSALGRATVMLLLSGDDRPVRHEPNQPHFDGLLVKPARSADIASRVRKLLSEKREGSNNS